jgi:hypothetical protein
VDETAFRRSLGNRCKVRETLLDDRLSLNGHVMTGASVIISPPLYIWVEEKLQCLRIRRAIHHAAVAERKNHLNLREQLIDLLIIVFVGSWVLKQLNHTGEQIIADSGEFVLHSVAFKISVAPGSHKFRDRFFSERLRHGESDPGARPRWEDKDLNQGSQSTHNGIGLAIAGLLAVSLPTLRSANGYSQESEESGRDEAESEGVE